MKKNRATAIFIILLTLISLVMPTGAALAAGDQPPAPLMQVTDTPTLTATSSSTVTLTPTPISTPLPQWWQIQMDWSASYADLYTNVTIPVSACGPDAMIASVFTQITGLENQYARWRQEFNDSASGQMTGNISINYAWKNSNINWAVDDPGNIYAFADLSPSGVYSFALSNGFGANYELYRDAYMTYQGPVGRAHVTMGGYIWCYGVKQNAILSQDNLLGDGDMEQFPTSIYWNGITQQEQQTVDFPFYVNFGRLQETGDLLFNNGEAKCNNGLHAVGPYLGGSQMVWAGSGEIVYPILTWPFGQTIQQDFYWPGGTLYWKVSARGRIPQASDFMLGVDLTSHALAYLMDVDGSQTVLLNQVGLTDPSIWDTFRGAVTDIPAGTYRLVLDHGPRDSYAGGLEVVYYDDISIGSTPRIAECDYDSEGNFVPHLTTTPTPSGPTVTPVTGTPSPLNVGLVNCNFENGINGWQKNDNASIQTEWNTTGVYGAVGPHFGQTKNTAELTGRIWQEVNIPRNGTIYFQTFKIGLNAQAYLRPKSGGDYTYLYQDIPVNADQNDANADIPPLFYWSIASGTAYVTQGNYDLVLTGSRDDFSQWISQQGWDGVSLSLDGFVANGCNSQPTPTYEVPPTHTPTVTGTPPTRTPTVTFAYTRTPTPTPPGWSGTPSPPGQAYCERPSNWLSVGGWMDHYWCKYMEYTSWKPQHQATLAAFKDIFLNKDPFYAVNVVTTAADQILLIMKSFNWKIAPAYKMPGAPMVDLNSAADVNQDAPTINNLFKFGLSESSPYNGGQIDLTGGAADMAADTSSDAIRTKCRSQLTPRWGYQMSESICFALDTANKQGVTPWLEMVLNVSILWAFLASTWKRLNKMLRWELE